MEEKHKVAEEKILAAKARIKELETASASGTGSKVEEEFLGWLCSSLQWNCRLIFLPIDF